MKKKILFIMPAMQGGGAERTLINLLQKIDYSAYEVDLVSIANRGVYIDQIPENVNLITLFNNGFLVRVLAYLHKKYSINFLQRSALKRKVVKKYDIGISFLDGDTTDMLFFIDGLDKRAAWIHSSYRTNNNFWKFYKNDAYRNKLKKKRYGRLDTICFVSEDAKLEFIEVFGSYPDMRVIYNLIDAEAIKQKAAMIKDIPKKGFTFVALGSLVPVKGFDRLIRAAALVKEKGFDFYLDIYGAGKEQQNLQGLIDSNGLGDSVRLAGFQSNPYPYLDAADVFVMSSVSEALPTVLCEAMILGKPTLVTDCSGCRGLVDRGQFGLMADQDDNSLADKMIQYLSDPALLDEFSAKSLQRAKLFDDKLAIADYYSVFNL